MGKQYLECRQSRDLMCEKCAAVTIAVLCRYNDYPKCKCGGEQFHTFAMLRDGGKAPATDVFGSPQYSDATGQEHSSTRDRKNFMRNHVHDLDGIPVRYEEAGDKVGGMRIEHRLKKTGFSGGGMSGNRSTVSEGV